MQLSAKVIEAIDRFVPQEKREAVIRLLAGYGDAAHEKEAERIHLIILKIGELDLERMDTLVKMAKRDYRDVIMAATAPLRMYIVGLLRDGPNAVPGRVHMLGADFIQKWRKAGAVVIGGRFQTKGDPRGMYIFTLDSLEAAEALVQEDPAIQSGRLRFEFHRWLAVDGLQIGKPLRYLDIDIH